MKTSQAIGLVVISFAFLRPLFGQGFVNLNFEQATIAPTPVGGWTYPVDPAQAFPGWTVGSGVVMYNDLSIGSPATALMGPNFPNAANYTSLEGSYSALLQYFGFVGPAPSLSQTGLVPAGAHSVSILVASGTSAAAAVVTVNGFNIPLFAQPGNRLAGDISVFAGMPARLTISTPNSGGWLYFDAIRFSSVQIPEPRSLSCLGLSIFFLFGRRIGPTVSVGKAVQAVVMSGRNSRLPGLRGHPRVATESCH